ncbi:MAG: tryptophan-rich sensory protein [Microlunatus sp.]|nr:tryptophan-rich sensory protein [Microlunatus sp.]
MERHRWTGCLATSTAVHPRSDWYRRLVRPEWQPPSAAFGRVWTALYASIVWSGGRSLDRAVGFERRRYVSALIPYAIRTSFATAANADILRRNRGRG